ncbi:MAG TPA: hypothetical protein VGX03_27635 [Candidatus Binatia bacterium]|jgi:hypothetical protein|nr:hypothetical protein [Candidatus Binatia bacterium]
MVAAVCTLFENDYHYGVGALVNSLYRLGFRGVVWAGYRGPLPPWARPIKSAAGYEEYQVAPECIIRFVPLATNYHLTNYKPHFMLQLWTEHCPEAEALFYFDPDIVVKCRWSFFEEWVTYGIALCEDVTSPVPARHPMKMAWQQWCERHGIAAKSANHMYFNCGFLGVRRPMSGFLREWLKLLELVGPEVGGLQNQNVRDRSFVFCKTDQDALNIAVMCSDQAVSPIGPEGMDFKFGGYTMSHAIGPAKPWRKSMIADALRGRRPSLADRSYWRSTEAPIRLYSPAKLLRKRAALLIAAGIGRYFS